MNQQDSRPIYTMVATCPDELTDIISKQITTVGGFNISEKFKSVEFDVDDVGFYKAHLYLSAASQIFLKIKEGSGSSLEIIYNQASKVQWTQIFSPKSTYKIDGIVSEKGPEFPTSNDVSKRVRQAIENKFAAKGLEKPLVDIKEPDLVIKALLYKKRVTFSICTSGKSMHKRGYRVGKHPAPMKETLAAGILDWMDYSNEKPLVDAMCGSGTIAIEATYKALNKACLIHRKKGDFSFEKLRMFNPSVWRQVQEEARTSRLEELNAPIYAKDLDSHFLKDAQSNALKARVEKYIEFETEDFLQSTPKFEHGTLILNLPYGARLEKEHERLAQLYKDIGAKLKHDYAGWDAVLITAENAPIKEIGLKPKKKKKIQNGSIKTMCLWYELFRGKHKVYKTSKASLPNGLEK